MKIVFTEVYKALYYFWVCMFTTICIYIHVVEYIMYTLNCLRRMALPNGSNIDNTLK